jgi:hypothetical protein
MTLVRRNVVYSIDVAVLLTHSPHFSGPGVVHAALAQAEAPDQYIMQVNLNSSSRNSY